MFWAAGDLGNIGGPHLGTVAHPTLTTPTGRPAAGARARPGSAWLRHRAAAFVSDLVLLGDGDSDPFLTAQTLERARRRYASPQCRVAIAMAPAGRDFNDLIRRSA